MPSSQRSRDFLLPQGQPASKHVLLFSELLAHRESLCDKTTVLLQLIDVLASSPANWQLSDERFFVLTNNWANLVFHTLARCKLRTTLELFEPFFNVLLLSHWKAQAGSNTITSPGMPANVRTSQTHTLVRQSNWCVGCFVHTTWIPYRNVTRQSPLIFSIFLHQISCTRVQSISETTSHKSWKRTLLATKLKVRGLPHNALHFPSYYWGEPQASPTVTCWLGFLSRYIIYIYIYIYRPADLCLWSGARRQGRMLRAKSSRRNFVWERSSVLVHACSFTFGIFVFEFVTDRTCQSLAFAFDCQHWTTGQKI